MSHELKPGQVLDSGLNKYTIRSVLGTGGFGITYSASFATTINSLPVQVIVAIKEHFLKSDCSRDVSQAITYSQPAAERVEGALRTFVSEARRLHSISGAHPNIVHVSEVFSANNTAYYVMEFLEGESLAAYVERNKALDWDTTMRLMLPVVDAVAFLHRNRITHLDIKPANIMLAAENDSLRPVLIDFGLSKHYNEDGSATSTIGTQGFSDGYAPVEQYVGISSFSPASDVYSLAATILFCLTGKTPPKSINMTPAAIESLIPASVPAQARKVLADAMAIHYADRIPDAGVLLDRLKAIPAAAAQKDDTRIIDKPADTKTAGKQEDTNLMDSKVDTNLMDSKKDRKEDTRIIGDNDNPVPPTPPVDNNPSTDHIPAKSSKKKLLAWLFVIIALLAAGAGAWYLISESNRHSSVDDDTMKTEATSEDHNGELSQAEADSIAHMNNRKYELINQCNSLADDILNASSYEERDELLRRAASLFVTATDYMAGSGEDYSLCYAAARLIFMADNYMHNLENTESMSAQFAWLREYYPNIADQISSIHHELMYGNQATEAPADTTAAY